MKRSALINRREFAKLAGGVALAVPLAPAMAWTQEPAKKPETQPPQQAETPKPEPPARSGQAPLKLSKEQEEAVKKAIERRDRQLAALRGRTLPYDAEPAFVFSVRRRSRQPKV